MNKGEIKNMNMAIICLIAGVLFICAEIFLPGGILGLFGVASMIASSFFAYQELGGIQGTYFLIFEIFILLCVIMISLKFLPKSWVAKRMFLNTSGKGYSSHENKYESLLGKTGEVYSDLRPVGVAVLDGKKYEVYAQSGFIEKGTAVEVVKVEASNIIVKKKLS